MQKNDTIRILPMDWEINTDYINMLTHIKDCEKPFFWLSLYYDDILEKYLLIAFNQTYDNYHLQEIDNSSAQLIIEKNQWPNSPLMKYKFLLEHSLLSQKSCIATDMEIETAINILKVEDPNISDSEIKRLTLQ